MDNAKSSFNVEKGYEDVEGEAGLKFDVCARGLWKLGEVKGKA